MLTQRCGFILVPAAGPYVQQSVCAHCINSHRGARRGGLEARRERRQVLQVPATLIEASANIVECGVRVNESRWVCVNMPAAGRLPPPFIDQGEVATSVMHSVMYSGSVLAYIMSGVTVVLVNPCASRGLMKNSASASVAAAPVLVGE
jgi:hypothetical protein